MDTPYKTFGQRVDGAIDHLTHSQLRALNKRHPDAPGVRALVMAACDMPHLSILSDITSGRMPGHKYRQQLAAVLGVKQAWLEDGVGDAPDWALSPIEAWRRFEERLRQRSDVLEEDDSAHPDSYQRRCRIRASALAEAYQMDIGEPFIQALAYGRYAEVPFDDVLRYAQRFDMAPPTHPEHLRTGHALWVCVQSELKRELNAVRKRFFRYIPPPELFAAIRLALLAQKKQPKHGDAMVDALEMLWRQQWVLTERSRSVIPATLRTDTGRNGWSRLDEIRLRWTPW